MQRFDVIVIGSGAGNIVATDAAKAGLKVALVEHGPLGGTCLNRGCIPSKMLIYSADVANLVRRAHMFGVEARISSVDWQRVVHRVTTTIDEESRRMEQELSDSANLTLFKGTARFVGRKELDIDNARLSGESIVIATGSRPSVPSIPGLEGVPYITSDEALRLEVQPKRLAIIGGGFIGVELAHFFSALGTDVTLVCRGDKLLSQEDEDVARRLTEVYARNHNLLLNAEATQVERTGDDISLHIKQGDQEQRLSVDTLLFATGRTPNTDELNLAACGVELDDKGFVRTDEYLQANVPGVWALGDVAGKYMLRHVANLEARCVADNVLHPESKRPVDYHAMPHAVFSSPQIGAVGLTEQQAGDKGFNFAIGRRNYSDTAYGGAIEDKDGFVKVIADANTHEILGCHVIGTDAAVLVQEAVNAMRRHDTTDAITESVYIHPALQEVVSDAFGAIDWPRQLLAREHEPVPYAELGPDEAWLRRIVPQLGA